jgi:hypothetical protein
VAAATLEAAFAVCLGCIVHNRLFGCDDCGDIRTPLVTSAANTD